MDYFWLATGLLLLFLLCLYLSDRDDEQPGGIVGMWVGTPRFLNNLGIYYLGVEITNSNFIVDIQAVRDGPVITQKYSYTLKEGGVIFKSNNISDDKLILPSKKLNLMIEEDQLAIIDESTTYLILIKFR